MVTIGEGIRDTAGCVVQVTGYLIDVTDSLHRDLAAATQQAVSQSAETRSVIDQAKGALMITYGINSDEAFAVLRWHSQHRQHQTPGHRHRESHPHQRPRASPDCPRPRKSPGSSPDSSAPTPPPRPQTHPTPAKNSAPDPRPPAK